MSAKLPHLLCSLVMLAGGLALAGCDVTETPKALSAQAIATREAAPEHVFRGELGGQRVYLLLHQCEVYSVKPLEQGEVEWHSVLSLEFYPFGSACDRQSMEYRAGELTVKLGRMALGAGGCCIRSGTFRSADGLHWTKISDSAL